MADLDRASLIGTATDRLPRSLLDIGALNAQAFLIAGSGVVPQLLEYGPPLGIETLNGKHRDIAVLRINPRESLIGWPQHAGHHDEANGPPQGHQLQLGQGATPSSQCSQAQS